MIGDTAKYYYRHQNIAQEACYYCLVQNSLFNEINSANGEKEHKRAYQTALARERYAAKVSTNIVVANEEVEIPENTITISPSNTNWTNQDVQVTITTTADENKFQLQYSTNGSTWADYSKPLTMSENGKVYGRLVDKGNASNVSLTATLTLSNIDKTAPTINTALSGGIATTTTISLSTKVTDANSGLGKIVWYYKKSTATSYSSTTDTYKTLNGAAAGTTTAVTKTKTLSGLASNTTYNVYAEVYDVAGNNTRTPTSAYVEVKTNKAVETVPTGNISFSYSTKGNFYSDTGWTNEDVSVTIEADTNIYTLQYSKDGITYYNYTGPVNMESNGDIYARLLNGETPGEPVKKVIDFIDKKPPKSFQLHGNGPYTIDPVTDEGSGIYYYEYTINGNNWIRILRTNSGKITVPENVTGVRAVDKAGNTTYGTINRLVDPNKPEIM